MWFILFLEQAHFGIYLIGALVFFTISWLYFDAWLVKKTLRETVRVLGYFSLALSFVIQATILEVSFSGQNLLNPLVQTSLAGLLALLGYAGIFVSLLLDPIQPIPDTKDAQIPNSTLSNVPVVVSIGFKWVFSSLSWLIAVLCGILYWRRSTKGLERHLKPVAIAFFFLAFAELLGIASVFANTTNIAIFQLVAPFGIIWIASHLVLLTGLLILQKWIFGYLLKRFETQLFIILSYVITLIFIITTVTFTSLLFSTIQEKSLEQLGVDVKVLNYALESKKNQIFSDTEGFSSNPSLVQYISESSPAVRQLTQSYLLTKKHSSLIVVNRSGQVVARGEDTDRFGDSLSDEPLVSKALAGKNSLEIVAQQGVLTDELTVKAVAPVLSHNEVIGAVIASSAIDNAFLDGIKSSTELDSTIFVDEKISATTLIATDGETRPLGIIQDNNVVKQKVFQMGQEYQGVANFLGKPYLGAYLPLVDNQNKVLGMMFLGRPQETILSSAAHAIELTFVVIVVLLIISIIPALLISKTIANQVK